MVSNSWNFAFFFLMNNEITSKSSRMATARLKQPLWIGFVNDLLWQLRHSSLCLKSMGNPTHYILLYQMGHPSNPCHGTEMYRCHSDSIVKLQQRWGHGWALFKNSFAIIVNTSHKRNAKVRCLIYRPYIAFRLIFGSYDSVDNSDASQNDSEVTRCRNKMNHCCDFVLNAYVHSANTQCN